MGSLSKIGRDDLNECTVNNRSRRSLLLVSGCLGNITFHILQIVVKFVTESPPLLSLARRAGLIDIAQTKTQSS